MSFPRHLKYKDSGVEWLGKIPEGWTTKRLKTLFEVRKRIAGEEGFDVLSITQKGLRVKDIDSNDGQLAMDYSKYQFVEPGDFAMNHMDLLTGWIDIAKMSGVTSPDYRVFSTRLPGCIDDQYYLYLFQNAYRERIFYAFGQGASQLGRWRMPTEQFNDFSAPYPPIDEQRAIATLLNSETAKIDALVEEQRRLIELLKEKRQAVISQVVTKGLDPTTRMKPSGIEWLGDVPSHWTCGPLKRFASIIDCKHFTVEFMDDGLPVVSIRELEGDRIRLADAKLTSEQEWQFLREGRIPTAGDLIFCRNASVGAVGEVYPGLEFCMGQDVCLIRPDHPSPFYHYVLSSTVARNQIEALLIGATIRRLNVEAIRNLSIAQPPEPEMALITAHLREVVNKSDALIHEAANAVDLLQERRSVLISAAVTGKINVAVNVPKPVRSTWSAGFARQVLAAEILSRCNSARMGRIKLQKLIHLCEYHAQLNEVRGTYSRQAAGPFAPQLMEDVREGLSKQRWFEEYKDESRYAYRALEKAGEHKQYLHHWEDEQAKIDLVLNLLGGELTKKCEIASTLYAAWNDLISEGKKPTDAEIIHEASSAERWHESKEKIAAEKWPEMLKWMRAKGLVPVGYGTHTMHQPDLFKREGHEPAY